MHGNWIGILASVLLIELGFVLHNLISKKNVFLARKILHIWVCNWFFIYKYLFNNSLVAMIGLLAFATINLLLEFMIIHSRRYGTVYYPLSIVALLCFCDRGYGDIAVLGCAILIMGYGDGLAAIVGNKFKSKNMPFLLDKTVLGSLTMFIVSTVVTLVMVKCSIFVALAVGLVCTLAEAYMPWGLDNISVPLAAFFLVDKLC